MRGCRIGLAVPVLLVVAGVLLTRIAAVLASHPAYLVVLVVAGAVALVALATGLRRGRKPRRRSRRSAVAVRAVQVVGVVGVVAVVGVLGYLRPSTASEVAVAAMAGDAQVRVEDGLTEIVLSPVDEEPRAGLVFYAGALVDPRAYVPLLREVARDGFEVHVLKPPLGVALLGSGAAGSVIEASPEVGSWAVGGHSLGGVAAAEVAQDRPDGVAGLVLWASYPQGSLAGSDLAVTSVSATEDGLATPEDVEASREDLPPGTTYVAVEGAVHSFFGDYGPQRGDGEPTVDRSAAQSQIVAATTDLMEQVVDR